jgi:hypothetical protein
MAPPTSIFERPGMEFDRLCVAWCLVLQKWSSVAGQTVQVGCRHTYHLAKYIMTFNCRLFRPFSGMRLCPKDEEARARCLVDILDA